MEANQKRVDQLFSGEYKFIIPVYQRNYEWSKIHTEQLLDDIKATMFKVRNYRISNNDDLANRYAYFIGSIVTYSETSQKLLLIDGQQRTTTICLIFMVLRDLLLEGRVHSTDVNLQKKISNRLIDQYDESENRLKLKPINNDLSAYQNLVFGDEKNPSYKETNVYKNYHTIKNYLIKLFEKAEFTIDNFWEALSKLEFVWIELREGSDNPQKIFESLNATGAKLEEADLIRNYVLMNVSIDKQEEYYKQYWKKIEDNCLGHKLTEFMRYYLILETKKYINEKDVYKEFKLEYAKFDSENLRHLTGLSNIFRKIKNGEYDKELDCDYLFSLDYLKFGTSLSLQMQIMSLYDNKKLEASQVKQCLSLLESYFVRRKVCGYPTNALNKIMPSLVKSLDGLEKNSYIFEFEKLISAQKNNFPNEKQFTERLKSFDLYSTKNFCTYFLSRIEKSSSREHIMELSDLIQSKKISIEHIFPQEARKWKDSLSDENFRYLKDEKLHTLANLTLTGYNSGLSNKKWIDKLEIFKQSSFVVLNGKLKEFFAWNRESLEIRENFLINKVLELWKRPNIQADNDNELFEKKEVIGLFDIPTKTKPVILEWKDSEYIVSSWRDVFIKIISELYENNPEKFQRLMKYGELGKYILSNKDYIRDAHQISDGIYLNLHSSAEEKFKQIRKILDCFDEYDIEDIAIQVRYSQESDIDEEEVA